MAGRSLGAYRRGWVLQAKELWLSYENREVLEVCKAGSDPIRLAFVLNDLYGRWRVTGYCRGEVMAAGWSRGMKDRKGETPDWELPDPHDQLRSKERTVTFSWSGKVVLRKDCFVLDMLSSRQSDELWVGGVTKKDRSHQESDLEWLRNRRGKTNRA